jgi:diacylglycerol O-acyltransferase / wax synthase
VTGALHAVLVHRGEDAGRFVISVPVAGRRSAGAGQLGNEVGVMTVPVTVTGSPYERLAVIARSTRLRRPATPSASAALLGPVFRTLAWSPSSLGGDDLGGVTAGDGWQRDP